MFLKRPKTSLDEPVKPLLRGKIHRYGFYFSLIAGSFILVLAKSTLARLAFFVYLLSVLLMYGVSSTYHLNTWKNMRVENLMQKLDHSCIYLLIAGTYTPVCLLCLPSDQEWVMNVLKFTWFIAVLGVLRSIFFTNIPKIINVAFYLLMGFIILPYLPMVVEYFDVHYSIFFIGGGALYSIGGVVYGLEKPDPIPKTFGFHEIFHLCTVLANLCFAVPIVQNAIY